MFAVVRYFDNDNTFFVIKHERAETPEKALAIAKRNDRLPGPIGQKGRPGGYVEVDEDGILTKRYAEVKRFQ